MYSDFNEVYLEYFPDAATRPARACFGGNQLPFGPRSRSSAPRWSDALRSSRDVCSHSLLFAHARELPSALGQLRTQRNEFCFLLSQRCVLLL